jgi:HD-like signal output (HDOD) protein
MPPPRVLTPDEVALRVTAWRPLPPVLHEVVALREADPTAIAHLGTIVDADPYLDRRIRFLGGRSPVLEGDARSEVHAAIQQIGYRRVHCGAVAVLVVDAMAANANSFDFLEYWGSAAACAALAASIAEVERSPARDLAYTAGLLHNAGLWAVDMVAPDLLAQLYAAVDDEGWSEALEEAILGFTLNDVTSALLRRWHLPLEIAEAHLVHNEPALWATRPLARALWQARDGLGAAGIADPLRGIPSHATASPTARTVLDRFYGGGSALLEGAQRLVGACLLARESLEQPEAEEPADGE